MLHGQPGTGKTVTAIEVVKRVEAALDVCLCFWIQGDGEAILRRELERFGVAVVPGLSDDLEQDEVLRRVHAYLSRPEVDFLLVVDDLTDAACLERYVPLDSAGARVLVCACAGVALGPLSPFVCYIYAHSVS